MNWSFFQRRVCLTTLPEEWEKAEQEFARVGLTVQKFQSLPIDDDQILGPHQSFSGSVRQILTEFYNSEDRTLLHLEDDCEFKDLHHLEDALYELPYDWDIVYLGANVRDPNPRRFSRHLYRVTEAWTTHAIGFNRKVVPFILDNQPGLSEAMLDNWLGSQLHLLNAYVVSPMVAWQRPRFSTIWQRETDYNEVFVQSQNRLQ